MLVRLWRRSLRSHSGVTNIHLVLMCGLNVCMFLFQGKFWDLYFHPAIDEDEGNHQEQVRELITQTTESMDNLALKMLFVTIQQNNLEVCIEYAVNMYVVL